ncbi:MAG: lamin tail domain-containing protein, partial [Verrucomicrobiota bacterium]
MISRWYIHIFLLLCFTLTGRAYDSVVVFNEVMYHAEGTDTNEWVELYNQMSVDVDLSHWSIDGIDYTFPDGTILEGGKYLVVASNPETLKNRYQITNVFGPFTKNLANSGERIRLRNLNQRIIDELEYEDEDPWPAGADGTGYSLSKAAVNLASEPAENWRTSLQKGGTPGTINFPGQAPSPALVINEITDSGAATFWAELLNLSSNSIPLTGFTLTVVGDVNWTYEFTDLDVTLGPGEFLALDQFQLQFRPAKGDRLLLANSTGELLDFVEVKKTARARNWTRNGSWYVPGQSTKAAPNLFHLETNLVINELMYHPRPIEARPAQFEATDLVTYQASWRFRQDPQPLQSDWMQPSFDDATWQSGAALFYNETSPMPEPKTTPLQLGASAYFFRTQFTFNGSTNGVQLALEHIIDDGAVFYLNGHEVYRFNMPEGPVDYSTFASSGIPDATRSTLISIPSAYLLPGQNLLAVEVHQTSLQSSDVVFGCKLIAQVMIAPPTEYAESTNQWVELYNRGTNTIDLTGWTIAGGPSLAFAPGTSIAPGGFLILAASPAEFKADYPDLDSIPFTGKLSRGSGSVKLKDQFGNLVDSVTYSDSRPWPESPDGQGSTLERINPFSERTDPAAWAASISTGEWKTYSYSAVAESDSGPTLWHEFVFGLLDAGEVLLDDFSVVEDPSGAHKELLQNGDFERGAVSWRFLGTHRNATIIDDPNQVGNKVLRLIADGPTEHMHNHVETTFLNNTPITNGKTYQISFRAKYITGCPKLNTRLYFNRVAKTTLLDTPALVETPGRQNSTFNPNTGPQLTSLSHFPVVPKPSEPVLIAIESPNPDEITACTLWSGVNGTNWVSSEMLRSNNRFTASISAKPLGTVVQFYVEARSANGATTAYPATGAQSRALYRVNDNQRLSTKTHNFRLIMLPAEASAMHSPTNVMSNGGNFATLIYDESEVFYNCSLHLQSSERGRSEVNRVGYTLSFPCDHLFRGVHDTITFDRSGGWSGRGGRQDEIVMRHIINQAGGLPDMYNDLANLIAPDSTYSGPAMLLMAKYGSQFIDGTALPEDGSQFKIELVYYPTTTVTGDPQSPKLPQPDDVTGQDLHDMGNNPEDYRWYLLAENKSWRSDYRQIMEVAKLFSLSEPAMEEAANRLLDVNQWTRVFAAKALSGDVDTYGFGYPHNQLFYVAPGAKAITLPWDMDFAWSRSPSDSIDVGSNVGTLINSFPAFRRLYLGHIDDIIKRSFNSSYMSRWTTHYGSLVQQNYGGVLTYISQRATAARTQLPGLVPFKITSNNGQDFITNTLSVLLEGTAPFTYKQLDLRGVASSGIKWQSISNWSATLTLTNGLNTLQLIALDFQNQPVATNTLHINADLGAIDSYQDGMLDNWEIAHGLNPKINDAAADLDGDGFINFAEYLAGTDPADATDSLRLGSTLSTPNQVTLNFVARAMRSY